MKELIELLDQLEHAVSWAYVCFDDCDDVKLNIADERIKKIRMEIIEKFRKLDNKRFRIRNFAPGNKEAFFEKLKHNE